MGTSFVQTDIATGICSGSICSGVDPTLATVARNVVEGGSVGSSPASVAFDAFDGLIHWGIKLQIVPGAGFLQWKAGTHTVPIRVSTANANVMLRKLWACWVSSACGAKGTLGLNDAMSISLGTTGVKLPTVAVNAPANPLSTDRLLYVFGFDNTGPGFDSFAIVPDQSILTPLEIGAPYYTEAGGLYVPGPQASGLYVPGAQVAGVAQ